MHARLEEINAELLPLEQVRSQFDFMYFIRRWRCRGRCYSHWHCHRRQLAPLCVCVSKRKAATQQAAVELLWSYEKCQRYLIWILYVCFPILTFWAQMKTEITMTADKKTSYLTWVGLGLMSVQFGVLARLTWWEYSWDIMEPVTYFVTYGTAMAAYAYYCLTKQVTWKSTLVKYHNNTWK